MVRPAILGVAVLFVGINLTFRVIIFALAGGMGPMPLLQAFFYGGIVLISWAFLSLLLRYFLGGRNRVSRNENGCPDRTEGSFYFSSFSFLTWSLTDWKKSELSIRPASDWTAPRSIFRLVCVGLRLLMTRKRTVRAAAISAAMIPK